MIRGESEEYGVITVPDDEWDEIKNFEGNWEDITETIIKKAYQSDAEDITTLRYDNVVEILRNEDIVNFEPSSDQDEETINKEEQKKAELLIDYLINEGIYDREGDKVTVLQGLEPTSSEYVKFNWSVFLTVTADRFEDVVEQAKDMKDQISDYYDRIGANDVNPDKTKRKLIDDLYQLTDGNSREDIQPKRVTADNRIIPPDSVLDRDKYEYKEKLRELEAWELTDVPTPEEQEGEGEGIEPIKQLDVFMKELNVYTQRFRSMESEMRERSIPEIVNLEGIVEDLEQAKNIATGAGVFAKEAPSTAEEYGDFLKDVCEETGYETGTTEEDDKTKDTQKQDSSKVDDEDDYVTEGEETSSHTTQSETEGDSSDSDQQDSLKGLADSLKDPKSD